MPIKKKTHKKDHEPHDAVFKVFFSDTEIARKYLQNYTSETIHSKIDFSVFHKIDATFVSGRFGVSFSDVLYETRLTTGAPARLLFLVEHKSYLPSSPVFLQLLDYLMQIWDDDLRNRRPLSFVIPIVVYHGTQEWKQKPFSSFFPGLPEDWQMFIPNFQYILTDLSQIPLLEIEEKVESEYLKNLFLALKFSRNKNLIIKNWLNIHTFGETIYEDTREGMLLQTLSLYIFNLFDMTESQVKSLNKQLPKPEKDWIEAIPEIFGRKYKEEGLRVGFEEGIEKGMEKGIEKGLEKGLELKAHAITLKTIQKFPDWSNAEVAEFVGVSLKFVKDVRQELANKA